MNRETEITEATEMPTLGAPPGSILLGRYRVEREIGVGATSVVLEARGMDADERLAIKVWRNDLPLEGETVQRFVREARGAAALRSQHVARVRDAGCLEDGRPYIVMELLDGRDLGQILVEEGVLEPRRAVDLVLQACDAIAEAHALGIVHRDIKPTNLFVAKGRDGGERLAVLDFGISKAPPGGNMLLTQTASLLGTPMYMSIEQMRSPRLVDARTDIWALGAVLFEIVEGRPPFDGSTFAQLCVSVATEQPRPMLKAPHLATVVGRCLEKRLEDRYQSVSELAYSLAPFASDFMTATNRAAAISRVLGIAPAPTVRGWAPPQPVQPVPSAAERTQSIERTSPRSWIVVLAVVLVTIAVAVAMYFAI